ncbi:hypothetical protein B0H17DRAFT_1129829 [Mycena rosella]|uniref:Uncharacterized protein n=1 Tax=Mycena rosella TaxID=1033263 RepID=A0AAD7DSE2_MYCRO|nr:hypothetical protein B0H17DRAFT_1129829 [Mycena rosella]
MDYVPDVPSIQVPHALFLRSDMRYGTDDHTLWPQQWTAKSCHLPIIAKKGARPEIDIMWWDPTPADFEVGKAITRGLGRLRYSVMDKFLPHINEIVGHCKKIKDTSHFTPLFGELMQGIMLLAEQLQTLPTKYKKMVFAVTSLQRAWLELDALYDYTLLYRPRMNDYSTPALSLTPVAKCVGALTTLPTVAHQLWVARVPFWFLRPTHIFDTENILHIVSLLEPCDMAPDLPGEGSPVIIYSGNSTSEKIAAIHCAAVLNPWYRDPFETANKSPAPAIEAPPVAISSRSAVEPAPAASSFGAAVRANKQQPSQSPKQQRARPYPSQAPPKQKGPAKVQRDKFTILVIEQMLPSIAAFPPPLTPNSGDCVAGCRDQFPFRVCLSGQMCVQEGSAGQGQGLLRQRNVAGAPLEMSKCGWAAPTIEERFPYVAWAAKLMLDWTTKCARPDIMRRVAIRLTWSEADMQLLETAVCRYYTQAFWEHFGRAAVVPLRLDHDVEREDGQL